MIKPYNGHGKGSDNERSSNSKIRSATCLLAAILAMILIPSSSTMYVVYAQELTGVCNNHTIERGNFDDDPEDEVKVDGTVYNNGDAITLDGKRYTVMIGSNGTIHGTTANDFIVGTSDADTIYGKEGDDFIVGLGSSDWLIGDGIGGTPNDDNLKGWNDILCGNDGNDRLDGDNIAGGYGNDTITGGDDVLEGGEGDDMLNGDWISGFDGNDTITGGNDKLNGGNGSDEVRGDVIIASDGNDIITGGNDALEGGEGADSLYGDAINGEDGDDIGNGGDDIINVKDGTINNDYIDGDGVDAESSTLGNQDICASDPDREANCEYDDISSLATFNAVDPVDNDNTINQGQSINLVFSSSVNNPVTITDLRVITPNNITCTYTGAPITIPPNGSLTAVYPNNFTFTGAGCDTNTAGEYKAILTTEVGDPIITEFTAPFNVPEGLGIIGAAVAMLASLLIYARRFL
ncbi:MAG: calcium-binding protein [Candidatus Nitrosocaldus sp.]